MGESEEGRGTGGEQESASTAPTFRGGEGRRLDEKGGPAEDGEAEREGQLRVVHVNVKVQEQKERSRVKV